MTITPVDSGQNIPVNPTSASSVPPNFGNHYVKNITSRVMGILEKIKNANNAMEDRERGYYMIAALCVLVVIVLFAVLMFTGGVGAVGMIAAQAAYYPLIGVAAASIMRGRHIGNKRKVWQMPPFSADVKGEPLKEAEWKRLWDVRNQAKLAYNNVMDIVKKERSLRDVSEEEVYAKVLLKNSEKAEVDFWEFADQNMASKKIDQFNEARTKRGESEML